MSRNSKICVLLLLLPLIFSSKVSISYIEKVLHRTDSDVYSEFMIRHGDHLVLLTGSYGTVRRIFKCDDDVPVRFYNERAEKLLVEAVEMDFSEYGDLMNECRDVKNSEKLHSIVKSRVRRAAEDRTDPTTVRPTFIPPGNKFFNLLIYPGTVWCGTGNKATSFDDLGENNSTDECCRAHDYCIEFISGGETKYNFTNTRPYTISACACDYKFYKCLKRADTKTSRGVAAMFFDTLQVPCFNIEYRKYCADGSNLISCKDYIYGTAATLNYAISDIWKRLQLRRPLF